MFGEVFDGDTTADSLMMSSIVRFECVPLAGDIDRRNRKFRRRTRQPCSRKLGRPGNRQAAARCTERKPDEKEREI